MINCLKRKEMSSDAVSPQIASILWLSWFGHFWQSTWDLFQPGSNLSPFCSESEVNDTHQRSPTSNLMKGTSFLPTLWKGVWGVASSGPDLSDDIFMLFSASLCVGQFCQSQGSQTAAVTANQASRIFQQSRWSCTCQPWKSHGVINTVTRWSNIPVLEADKIGR